MKLEKKRSPYGNLENNSFALQIESKIMDLNLKRYGGVTTVHVVE